MTDVDVLVDAAALTADENITIQIVGDGAQNARLRERLRNEGVRNVVMKGSVARPEAMAMIRAADASIISLRKGIEESIPTKLYDSLSVGCPVVVVAEGEAKKEGASLGALCTPAGDAAALATTLRQLASLDKAALRKLGDAGKASLSRRDDRAGIMRELVARIGALA
jgi:glycosyltransferase involved in cell wall biosynthesis